MTVNYIPLESKSGFRSPGFLVNEQGDLTVDGNVQFNSQLNVAPDFTVNGVLVIDNSDSVVSLGSSIRNSNLSRLGTLEFLNIEGDLRISEGSTPYFNIVNGHVEITSVTAVGSVNNVDIGLVSPGDGNFKSLNVGPGDSQGELTVQGDIYTTGFVSIAAAPTEVSHATRKDYVDARISAFAIAFGA
jgi:hypothetical protein